MTFWKRIASNPDFKQSMIQYYDKKGLADIRVYFATWIEERIMSEPSPTSTELYNRVALQFYEDLKQKLIPLSNDNLMKFKLAEICTSVAQTPAVDLYTHLREGFQREIQLIDQMPQYNNYMSGGVNGTPAPPGMLVNNGIMSPDSGIHSLASHNMVGNGIATYSSDVLNRIYCGSIQKLGLRLNPVFTEINSFRSQYERFHSCFTSYNQSQTHMSPQERQATDLQLQEQCRVLAATRSTILQEMRSITLDYDPIQEKVINELKSWQRNQALAGNGAPFHDNLDEIQKCIELLVEMVGQILEFYTIMNMIRLDNNDDISEMIAHVRQNQQILVLSSFIVEKQPPQVMKTNTRFAAAVRWLIGPKLGISVNNPSVECIIMSEAQAQRHSAQRTMSSESSSSTPPTSGEIINNIGTMEYNNQTGVFSASFRTMQLKKIKRAEKKGTESVMDEKFALLFYTSVVVNDYRIRVWTLSLPVVVIVHGNQEPQSWATITWDNAFSDIVREPFLVPDRVPWSLLSTALNTKFESSTGRALTPDNLLFLNEKLFRRNNMSDGQEDFISWAQFCKEPLPDRSFTFWDWFFAIMKLTKDHLLSLWKAGLIIGFINKRKAEETLKRLPIGTFLLRFSDSELGGISVGVVNGPNSVMMLSPWTARDINIRGLADRVHDIDALRCIYPSNRLRDEAFGEFYTQRTEENTRRDGYVPNSIKAHVPAIENVGGVTPQYNMQSPHPQDMQMANLDIGGDIGGLDLYTDGVDKDEMDDIIWNNVY